MLLRSMSYDVWSRTESHSTELRLGQGRPTSLILTLLFLCVILSRIWCTVCTSVLSHASCSYLKPRAALCLTPASSLFDRGAPVTRSRSSPSQASGTLPRCTPRQRRDFLLTSCSSAPKKLGATTFLRLRNPCTTDAHCDMPTTVHCDFAIATCVRGVTCRVAEKARQQQK